tara:strand:+ start:142 stop:477 length:336 start_codon:yes stop_codon:yes gene_type:complete
MEKDMKSKAIMHISCIIIVFVSAIDTYWLSKNSEFITQVEQNPIGQYLIYLDNGDVSLFIFCKFIGTYLSIATLYFAWPLQHKKINIIAFSIALAQLLLLFYLYHTPLTRL